MRVGQHTRTVAVWSVVFAWLVTASSGAAADSSSDESPEYQHFVQQALHEYQLGNFSEAKAFFAQAHALSPNARTLRGLGMSAYELRHYVEAIDYFQGALDSGQRPLTLQMRGEISRLLGQARSFITHLRLTVQPATAEVRVDTRPVNKDAEGALLLDPGEHELAFEAADYEETTRTLRTDGGETLSLSVILRALHPPAEAQAQAPAAEHAAEAQAALAPGPAARNAPSGSVGPWVLIGSSAAVAIAGGVFLGIALHDKATVEHPDTSGPGPLYQDYASADKRVFPFSVIGITGISLGVAGLVGGLVWKLSSSGGAESAAQLEATPLGLRVRGRF